MGLAFSRIFDKTGSSVANSETPGGGRGWSIICGDTINGAPLRTISPSLIVTPGEIGTWSI